MRRAYAFGRVSAFALVVALAGCTANPDDAETAPSVEPSVAPVASPSPTEEAPAFPTEAFADISEDAVSRKVAAEFQAALIEVAIRERVEGSLGSRAPHSSGDKGR